LLQDEQRVLEPPQVPDERIFVKCPKFGANDMGGEMEDKRIGEEQREQKIANENEDVQPNPVHQKLLEWLRCIFA
jgi:hypothetical protein